MSTIEELLDNQGYWDSIDQCKIAEYIDQLHSQIKELEAKLAEIGKQELEAELSTERCLSFRSHVAELEAENAELEKCQQWQPIETAPKGERGHAWMRLAWGTDEDKITGDGFYADGKFFASACFFKLSGYPAFEYRQIEITPTHWMPLPDAPAIDAENAALRAEIDTLARYNVEILNDLK